MTSYKNAPIRKWQIDKITQKLKDIEEHEMNGRKLTQMEKIYHIFAHTFKHYDTEEEEETKGVSARELVLILDVSYDYRSKITIQDITMSENGYDWAGKRVSKAVRNLKSAIQRFKDWQEDDFKGKKYSNYYYDTDTAFNIYCLRTKKGNWYYYNVMNDKDLDKMKLHNAKITLGYDKHRRKLDEELDWIESHPEEYRKKKQKEAAELREKQKRRDLKLCKRLMEIEYEIGRKESIHDYVERIKERLSSCSTTEEKEIELELEEYTAELEMKQMKANLKKQQKEQQKKEKELWDKKPHVDVSLNKKMDEYVEEKAEEK